MPGEKKNWFIHIVRAVLAATGLYLQIVAYRYLHFVEASIVIAIYHFLTAVTGKGVRRISIRGVLT